MTVLMCDRCCGSLLRRFAASGLQKGVERITKVMMRMSALRLMVVLAVRSVSASGRTGEGLAFYLVS